MVKKKHERKTVIVAEIKASNPYVQVLLTSDLEQGFEIKLLSSQESSLTLRPSNKLSSLSLFEDDPLYTHK